MPPRARRAPSAALLLALGLGLSGCGMEEGSLPRTLVDAVAAAVANAWGPGSESSDTAATEEEPGGEEETGGLFGAVKAAVGAATGGGGESAAPSYYRYVEPGGSLRFVESLEEVPAELRASAEPVKAEPLGGSGAKRAARPRAKERPWAATAAAPARRGAREVVVYTTSWCQWCRKTIAYLDAKGVDYENRDIESDPAWLDELIEKTGQSSIPVVDVDGQIVRGFDKAQLDRLL